MPFDSAERPMSEGHCRLLVLADFLETAVPRERFDLNGWTSRNSRPDADCNTAACAAGWATTIPTFSAAGFHLESLPHNGESWMFPVFKGHAPGYESVEAFFEIDEATFGCLFEIEAYAGIPSVFDVATRIRTFVHSAVKAIAEDAQ